MYYIIICLSVFQGKMLMSTVRLGTLVLAKIKRLSCLHSRPAINHLSTNANYKPIKSVLVANRGNKMFFQLSYLSISSKEQQHKLPFFWYNPPSPFADVIQGGPLYRYLYEGTSSPLSTVGNSPSLFPLRLQLVEFINHVSTYYFFQVKLLFVFFELVPNLVYALLPSIRNKTKCKFIDKRRMNLIWWVKGLIQLQPI